MDLLFKKYTSKSSQGDSTPDQFMPTADKPTRIEEINKTPISPKHRFDSDSYYTKSANIQKTITGTV